MKEREEWLDYLRVFACILVALGHLLMSFQGASIRDTMLMTYLIETVYHFHVYIFFFCSGYLLQKSYQKQVDRKLFFQYKIIRCLDFLIVYILFSAVTFGIKLLLESDVNSPVEHSFLETLLKYPINQMWYLYAISVITLFTPVLNERRAKSVLVIAIFLKIIVCIPSCGKMIPVPLNYLANNQIWYVMGSLWAYSKFVLKKTVAVLLAGVFLLINTIMFFADGQNTLCNTLLTLVGIAASAGICYSFADHKKKMPVVWTLAAKHLLPIYLLHTICAAGIRIVLLRQGVKNYFAHLLMGVLFSFVVPIICGEIADRTKILNICFYPIKTIQKMKKEDPKGFSKTE